jgi:hypothetical protein
MCPFALQKLILQRISVVHLERLAQVSRGTGKECAVRNVSSAQKRVTVANANSTTAGLRPPLLRMSVPPLRTVHFAANSRYALNKR